MKRGSKTYSIVYSGGLREGRQCFKMWFLETNEMVPELTWSNRSVTVAAELPRNAKQLIQRS